MKSNNQVVGLAAIVVASFVLIGVMVLALIGLNPRAVQAQALPPRGSVQELNLEPSAFQAESTLARTITVVGEGQVTLQPDVAQINIGIEVVGDTVKDASSQTSDLMEAVLATLSAQGVAEKDIQTSGYSIWVERPYTPEGLPSDTTLYRVNNTVMVTIRDLDKVGAILDSTIEAGANNIYGVTFSVAEPGQLMSEARQKAVADALAKAQELAELNQVTLGEVVNISEVIGGAGGFYAASRLPALAEGMGGGASPISPGELEMSVQLQITYEIQ